MNQTRKLMMLLLVGFFSSGVALADRSDPEVVATIDLTRYVGTWQEIARAPNWYQTDCVRSSAEYALLSPTSISVRNVCHRADGSTRDIKGEAVVDESPAKLKVKFNMAMRGSYWIVALDPNYEWAVVSGPGKKSLYILARTAPMKAEVLKTILDSLNARGFKTTNLFYDQY